MIKYTKIVEELNDIIEKNVDAVRGYEKIADRVDDQNLIRFFERQAKQRRGFIDELKREVSQLGGTPDTSGSTKGSIHRSWIDFKTALSSDKEKAVLKASITGEQNAIGEYNDLLEEKELPTSTRNLLVRQKEAIETALREVQREEELRD